MAHSSEHKKLEQKTSPLNFTVSIMFFSAEIGKAKNNKFDLLGTRAHDLKISHMLKSCLFNNRIASCAKLVHKGGAKFIKDFQNIV